MRKFSADTPLRKLQYDCPVCGTGSGVADRKADREGVLR